MKIGILTACLLLAISIGAVNAQYTDSGTSGINISLISQSPDPARAGELVELRFMVENTGSSEARNLELELIPVYPFVAIPGEDYTRTITTLKAYQQGTDAVIIKFKVIVDNDAIRGTNEIKLTRTETGSDITITDTYEVEVTGTEYAQIIYVDKAKLYPGNETPLKFTITNVGNSPLRDLVFSWSEEEGVILPVYSDDTKYIKSIDVGESVEIEYIVVADVNAVQGLYQLDLSLKYETESGVDEELNTQAGIFVGGETDFDVTFSESSEGVTSLSVANVGNNPAYSVTVRIPEQDNYRVSGSTSTIVGNLDKGDYTIVSFQISQAEMPGSFSEFNFSQMTPEQRTALRDSAAQRRDGSLEVLIEYTDTTGIRHTVEKEVPIQFRSSDDTETTTVTTTRFGRQTDTFGQLIQYAALAVIAVILIGAYVKRKRLKAFIASVKKKKG
jgi:hypothetical protein